MSKQVLHLDFDYDFDLFAIVSPLRDYRLAWILNKHFHFDFIRKDDLEIHLPKEQRLIYFSIFWHFCPLDKIHHYLINNKSQQQLLIPEMGKVDYFLMIKGSMTENRQKELSGEIRGMQHVQALFEVVPGALKSKQNLIFDDSHVQ